MRVGAVVTDSWAGRTRQLVEIVARRGARTQIRAIKRTLLPRRWIEPGEIVSVPSYAVVDYGQEAAALERGEVRS
jgi:hypothetical protein